MNEAVSARRVVVCADDFGASGAGSRGIIELARLGAISATGCLIHAPFTLSYARLLKSHAPDVSIGLRLDLTDFVPAKMRASLQQWMVRGFLMRNINRNLMRREILSQMQRFEDLLDAPPAFIDGHRHVHQIPGIREPLLAQIKARYGGGVAIRSTWSPRNHNAKIRFMQELGARGMRELIARESLPSNTDFAGVYDLRTNSEFAARMQIWLGRLSDGGLIMCHPELPEREGLPRNARESEYCFLSSPAWSHLLARNNICLRPFSAV